MVDLSERYGNSLNAVSSIVDSKQTLIWTSIPGIIESFDPVKVTCTATPAVMYSQRDKDDKVTFAPIALLVDIPVIFPRGGGYTLTFPVKKGDECELHFQCRNMDSWWQSGGIQKPQTPRIHDISDAMAFVGPQSQAKKISSISTTSTQLRSDDGTTFVQVTVGTITIKATNIILDATTVTIPNGDMSVQSVTSYLNHKHDQANDAHGDAEQRTTVPVPGT